MLSRSIRIALIALLLAALPLRTWAASAMLFCADGPSSPATHAQHGDEHAGHDMAGGHAMHDTDDTAATDDAIDSGHGCSVCGACCTGVATGPAFAAWLAHPPATLSIPFAPPRYAGVDLARDQRPPVA